MSGSQFQYRGCITYSCIMNRVLGGSQKMRSTSHNYFHSNASPMHQNTFLNHERAMRIQGIIALNLRLPNTGPAAVKSSETKTFPQPSSVPFTAGRVTRWVA